MTKGYFVSQQLKDGVCKCPTLFGCPRFQTTLVYNEDDYFYLQESYPCLVITRDEWANRNNL